MRAAVFDGVGKPLRVEQRPDPTPGEGEVVVRVGRCGICGTDLHLTEGHSFGLPVGAVPGHEFSGEVVALGKGAEGVALGDKVTVMPFLSCGRCRNCLEGYPGSCANGGRSLGMGGADGGYAEYALAQARWCLPLPSALGLDDGALIEPLAVALHGIRLSGIKPGDRVLVVGAGPIGLAALFWAKRAGAGRVAVTAASNRREGLALSMGADAFVVPQEGRSLARGSAEALGGPADIVLECVGVPGMLDLSVSCVRRGGTVVVLGFCMEPEMFRASAAMTREARLQFAILYSREEFQICVDAFDAGMVSPRAIITDVVGLDAAPAAFEALRSRTTQCKVLIDPSA